MIRVAFFLCLLHTARIVIAKAKPEAIQVHTPLQAHTRKLDCFTALPMTGAPFVEALRATPLQRVLRTTPLQMTEPVGKCKIIALRAFVLIIHHASFCGGNQTPACGGIYMVGYFLVAFFVHPAEHLPES